MRHGYDFAEIIDFDWDSALVEEDSRYDYGETRYMTLGYLRKRLVMLVFTLRGDVIRVISLRKANSYEVRRYETQI